MPDILKSKYPRNEGEDQKIYDRAINARAFDILRGFLPAGATTQLSWTTNLHHAHDRLLMLFNHPLHEVQNIALTVFERLTEEYKHSFKSLEYYTTSEEAQFIRNSEINYFYDGKFDEFLYEDDIMMDLNIYLKNNIKFIRKPT